MDDLKPVRKLDLKPLTTATATTRGTGEANTETPHSQESPTSAQKPYIHLLQQRILVPFNPGPTETSEGIADDTREQPAW